MTNGDVIIAGTYLRLQDSELIFSAVGKSRAAGGQPEYKKIDKFKLTP
mgnify:CR=1 FL=1